MDGNILIPAQTPVFHSPIYKSHVLSVIIYFSTFSFVPCLFSSTSRISYFKTNMCRGSCDFHVRSATRPLWWWQ